MTPAIDFAKKHNLAHTIHSYQHDADCQSYGLEAVEKLGVNASQVFKTLVLTLTDERLVVAVIPVQAKLNVKAVAKIFSVKKAKMAEPMVVQRSTGYILGGVSPLGQKKALATLIDSSAEQHECIFVSAGQRGLEIELASTDLCKYTNARYADLALYG
ncbi:Cys-tRNA(Pro) deacylase [Thalassotalea sp. HSM 43]|uniref:Cys-tRNA(Pro) deacylase n=1 Tax=Thalassotalea sp. HSM 43 TaxID=2552945 RepID=UPI0010811B04|nr:Cys-tRNA(Pro) deacylase [Thalassotalea sp. HSM 43]QBY05480.1 Cys-tRNA(Pro) deacylase [Thalassotalea sp. HSM 43]